MNESTTIPRFCRSSAVFALVICFATSGCEAPNVHRSVSTTHPHAVLTSDNPPGFRGFFGLGREVSPYYINGRPTAFWRVRDHFQIPAGATVVHAIDTSEPYGYEPMRFIAVAGCRYTLRPTRANNCDAATISEFSPGSSRERIVSSAFRLTE